MLIISKEIERHCAEGNFSEFASLFEIPSKEEIHVWLMDLNFFHSAHKYLENYLSEEELTKANRF
jgi:hypothetical protein